MGIKPREIKGKRRIVMFVFSTAIIVFPTKSTYAGVLLYTAGKTIIEIMFKI
jgi:hypothetical protein